MKQDHSLLATVCEPVMFDNPRRNLKLAHQLLQIMRRERGLGLAANQVGINQRLFVMCVDDVYRHCFNPTILEHSDNEVVMKEGCLSFPGEFCDISRPERVLAQWHDASGKQHQEWLTGWHSRCFQHELDHLNGVVMQQRVTSLVCIAQQPQFQ